MWSNLESWVVLVSLGVSVAALVAWIREAGDDWLAPDTSLHEALSRSSPREPALEHAVREQVRA